LIGTCCGCLGAEKIYKEIKEMDPKVSDAHVGILPLWAKLGQYEKIDEMLQGAPTPTANAAELYNKIFYSKALALIVR